MTAPPLVLAAADTVAEAVRRMLELRQATVPVVDDKERYLGMFGLHRVLGHALPRVATMNRVVENLSFVTESIDDVRESVQRGPFPARTGYARARSSAPVSSCATAVDSIHCG